MEDVGNKGCTRRSPPHGPPYFYTKDVWYMTPVERLVAAGIRPDCAAESVMWYQAQGDDYGLQKYLDEVEARKEALDNGRIS